MDTQRIFLKQGEIIYGSAGMQISTVLGSCVAVTMYDRQKGFAAICHAVLPCKSLYQVQLRSDFEYVDRAIDSMLDSYASQRGAGGRLEIKVFGGARMLQTPEKLAVGCHNIDAALGTLDRHGRRPLVRDVGGRYGRYICFDMGSGKVMHRYLNKAVEVHF